ncbi:hypothetical protein [Gracilibacillus saliphilus]|uniref:hypothetical protein n=1 Tax=Gracilibacillus saliphilus TaxID=543890 RepID=UPI0013D07BCB|nr:hypothetical protein [Gracilibacillus saliphilus]
MSIDKWVIFTHPQDHFLFDLNQVSKIEQQLKQENVPYRTIYYLANKPTKYVSGKGLVSMTKKEEQEIISSIKEDKDRCSAS